MPISSLESIAQAIGPTGALTITVISCFAIFMSGSVAVNVTVAGPAALAVIVTLVGAVSESNAAVAIVVADEVTV